MNRQAVENNMLYVIVLFYIDYCKHLHVMNNNIKKKNQCQQNDPK